MSHLGDFDASAVIYGKFTTYRPSTGAAFTLGGTPALSVYKDNSVTQSTTGVTLTADFDTVTGLNHFAIDTSADGTFYSAGSFFDIVITTGTVDSVSVVGAVVASFTIRKDSSLKPTTAARTLDVSAGGEAGVDWANVGSPTTAVDLSGTTISTSQAVASVSGAVGSVTGNVGGNVVGSVGSLAAQAKADVNAEVDSALDTDIPAVPTAGSINDVLNDLDARLPASGTLSTLNAAAVNAEVVDALATDTYAEPGQGAPAATATLAAKINYLYKAWRNRSTQTADTYALYADDAITVDQKATVSDDATTFSRGEIATGP